MKTRNKVPLHPREQVQEYQKGGPIDYTLNLVDQGQDARDAKLTLNTKNLVYDTGMLTPRIVTMILFISFTARQSV